MMLSIRYRNSHMLDLRLAHKAVWILAYTRASVFTHVHTNLQARTQAQTLFAMKNFELFAPRTE